MKAGYRRGSRVIVQKPACGKTRVSRFPLTDVTTSDLAGLRRRAESLVDLLRPMVPTQSRMSLEIDREVVNLGLAMRYLREPGLTRIYRLSAAARDAASQVVSIVSDCSCMR